LKKTWFIVRLININAQRCARGKFTKILTASMSLVQLSHFLFFNVLGAFLHWFHLTYIVKNGQYMLFREPHSVTRLRFNTHFLLFTDSLTIYDYKLRSRVVVGGEICDNDKTFQIGIWDRNTNEFLKWDVKCRNVHQNLVPFSTTLVKIGMISAAVWMKKTQHPFMPSKGL
jgi:hypothetical protein